MLTNISCCLCKKLQLSICYAFVNEAMLYLFMECLPSCLCSSVLYGLQSFYFS
jgi:hypothetical protein